MLQIPHNKPQRGQAFAAEAAAAAATAAAAAAAAVAVLPSLISLAVAFRCIGTDSRYSLAHLIRQAGNLLSEEASRSSLGKRGPKTLLVLPRLLLLLLLLLHMIKKEAVCFSLFYSKQRNANNNPHSSSSSGGNIWDGALAWVDEGPVDCRSNSKISILCLLCFCARIFMYNLWFRGTYDIISASCPSIRAQRGPRVPHRQQHICLAVIVSLLPSSRWVRSST